MEAFALRLPMLVALDLVGFPVDEHRKVKEWADHGVALLSGVNTPADFAPVVFDGGTTLPNPSFLSFYTFLINSCRAREW